MSKIDGMRALERGAVISPTTNAILNALKACAVETPQGAYPCEECYLYPYSKDGRTSTGGTCFEHLTLDAIDLIAEQAAGITTLHDTVAIAQREAAEAQKERDAALRELAQHRQAVKDGRTVELPCKIGARIFEADGHTGKVFQRFASKEDMLTKIVSGWGKRYFATPEEAQATLLKEGTE